MPRQTTPSLRFSIQFISLAAQSGSSAKPIATVLFPSHSSPFRAIPSPFLNNSVLFQTFPPPLLSKLFRNNSCRLYVFPTQFIVFPNYSFASQVYAIPMLFSAIHTVSSPKLHFSTPRLVYAVPLAIIAELFLRHSRHFLSLPLPNESSLYFSMATQRHSTTLKTSRLNRSCCSQASDSLAVCSSHQGNLYSRC